MSERNGVVVTYADLSESSDNASKMGRSEKFFLASIRTKLPFVQEASKMGRSEAAARSSLASIRTQLPFIQEIVKCEA